MIASRAARTGFGSKDPPNTRSPNGSMFFAVCKIDGGFDRFTKIGSALSIISPDRGGVVERRELDSEMRKDGRNSKGPVFGDM